MEEPIRWEPLGGGVGVYRSPAAGFTTDALLLAWFSQPGPKEACADLGTGCGVIPLLWKSRGANGPIIAVELDPEAAALAERSIRRCGFSGAIDLRRGDLREYRLLLPHQGLDRAACNPPYYAPAAGPTGQGHREMARHGGTLSLEDLAAAARFTLRDGGRLCLCLPAGRLAEAMALFRREGLEPKRLRLVQAGPKKDPYLCLLECRKAGRTGLAVERTLLLHGEDGRPTPELLAAYGEYVVTREGDG